jgi:ankyrin repeat protein
VQLGAPFDLVDGGNEMSALYWASREGHGHVAKALLDGKYEGRGAGVNLQRPGGGTPLMGSSWRGRESIVRLLLERGARMELQDARGWTALHLAVNGDHAAVLEALCTAQGAAAVLALRGNEGRTPLALAIEYGHAACEAVLRAHGATA